MAEVGLNAEVLRFRGGARSTYSLIRTQASSESDLSASQLPTPFGVDKLRLSFPVDQYVDDGRWRSEGSAYKLVREHYVDGVRLDLRVGISRFEMTATVEFNPSRVLDPDGRSLCPAERLPEAAERAWTWIVSFVEPTSWIPGPGSAGVKRIDVTRDFTDLADPGVYIRGLASAPRIRAVRTELVPPGSATPSLYVHAGKDAGRVLLYDRHRKHRDVPRGTLRWEAVCLRGWLKKAAIGCLTDLDPSALHALAAERWDWSACGMAVIHPDQIHDVLVGQGWSATRRRALHGFLAEAARFDRPGQTGSINTERRLIEDQRAVGVVPSPLVPPGWVSWLDPFEGCERRW